MIVNFNSGFVSCSDYFSIDTDCADVSGKLFPVNVSSVAEEVIFVEQIIEKCMYVDTLDQEYVTLFPCSSVFQD